ncbi:MAG: sigma factor-like helix-turn-helix DNA-binding protein, partial [Patescibacteria group bacterium]
PSEFPEYESNNFLNSVFDKLDFISRDILKMRFVFGKSFKYIGRTLGISSGAARVRAHRAKKMFVETYKQMS